MVADTDGRSPIADSVADCPRTRFWIWAVRLRTVLIIMRARFFNSFRRRPLKGGFRITATVMVGVLIFVLLLEVALRIIPALIPERLLAEFRPELRSEIAQRRGLPTLEETVLIHRDDFGPELRIPKPFTKRNWTGREPGIVVSTQVDGMGFCNSEGHSYGEPIINLISLGDSFIWCTAIDPNDTWTGKLESLTGYSTYNLAAPDTGLSEHVQILKQFGIQKSPKFVIMSVFEGNDLKDAVTYESFVRESNDLGAVGSPPGASSNRPTSLPYDPCRIFQDPRQSIIGRYSYAFNILLVLAQDICDAATKKVTPASVFPDKADNSKIGFGYRIVYPELSIEFDPSSIGSDDSTYAERLRSQNVGLEIFNQPLTDFVELSEQHDFVPVVAYTPAAYTAYASNVVFDNPTLGDLMPWFSQQQRAYFKERGSVLDYVFIDLTPVLQNAAKSAVKKTDLLYFRSNRHLNQRGHTLVADFISETLGTIVGSPNTKTIQQP